MSDREVKEILLHHRIGLTVSEARKIEKILGRAPTLTEAILWGIQGSEHCSYKSSRSLLKKLPTVAPNVILGVGEDAGIVEIARVKNDRYGLIVGHESHNHPSQIVPFEGAATGVGGCVRDIACMGGRVIGIMDALRFGDLKKNMTRQIANGVVAGIGGYGNPIGVPNIGGDLYFDPSYNDNCLVNVVCVGLVKESCIIHSFVPPRAAKEKWDIIIVGKATDASGMGGASFASGILEESEKEKNKSSVQEPNPFLKRHILAATYELFEILQKRKLIKKVSFKDMGAGGVTCSTVEQVARAGLGAEIDLGRVHVAANVETQDFAANVETQDVASLHLPPYVIACSETQERFTWMCHPGLTRLILDHYNKTWDLPSMAENARASHIGTVKKGNYILKYHGETVVNASSKAITEGLIYNRPFKKTKKQLQEPKISIPSDLNALFARLLSSENIACRKPVYERYDKQVQGFIVLEAGIADASVIAPLLDENVDEKTKKIGMAFSTDCNPRYSLISAYDGAVNAVVESMRNVAAVGAYPVAITDCLNYGNPEKPDQMEELKEGIAGIHDACAKLKLLNHPKYPTPVISGNVSLYNESQHGHVAPTAIICCIGKIDDSKKAITMEFKHGGSTLYLLGKRKNELGGSEYYRLLGHLGANVPHADFAEAKKEISVMVEGVTEKAIAGAHDISEGGLAVTVAEMCLGGRGAGLFGANINLDAVPEKTLREDQKLFSETGGFVCEIAFTNEKKFLKICKKYRLTPYAIGKTTKTPRLIFTSKGQKIIDMELKDVAQRWTLGLREKL